MTDDELERCRLSVKNAVTAMIRDGRVPYDDGDDIIQDAMLSILRRGDGVKVNNLDKWAVGVAMNKIKDYQRRRAQEVAIKEELMGQPVDPYTIRPCQAIRGCPDALYEWEEQIGRWMVDNVPIWPAMLAKLRNHLLKHYGLKNR